MRVHILEIWNQYIITYFTIEIRIQEGFWPNCVFSLVVAGFPLDITSALYRQRSRTLSSATYLQ